jgi:hypothetical protein
MSGWCRLQQVLGWHPEWPEPCVARAIAHTHDEALCVLQEDRFGFEPEVTAKIAERGCRVYVGGRESAWSAGYHKRS